MRKPRKSMETGEFLAFWHGVLVAILWGIALGVGLPIVAVFLHYLVVR